MSKTKWAFRKTDVKRLIEATTSAGVRVGRVELQAGKVIVFPKGDSAETVTVENEWDGAE